METYQTQKPKKNTATKTIQTTIRLALEDIALTKQVAQRYGLKYQTYLKSVIHKHLAEEKTCQ